MFTGLIRDVGEVVRVEAGEDSRVFTIRAPALDLSREALGASIACNGVCLTVTHKNGNTFTVMASAETLAKTTLGSWQVGLPINLETSLRLGDELGGHLVYGHVDGLATCIARLPEGPSMRFSFSVAPEWARFIAPKGSVTLDGVSLTVNEVSGHNFGVNIIPHTLQHTGFAKMAVGQKINMEIDMLARYVARLMESKAA